MWWISGLSAGWFTLVLLFWAQGGLLYRVDFPGVYRPGGFLLFPSADYVIPSLAAAVSPGNIYVAQYLALFADAFLCTLGAQLLVREMFGSSFSARELLGVQALAATFYLLNPYNVTWGYYALTLNLFLHNAAFFLVMTLVVRLARTLLRRERFSWTDAIWLGIAVGLSAPTSFPNLIRTVLIEGIAFLILALLALYLFVQRSDRQAAKVAVWRFSAATLPLAILLLAYPTWLFVTNWAFHPEAIASVATRNIALFPPNSYNTLPNVVRLLGRSQFRFYPYYSLYQTNVLVVVGSWLWPLLAIAVPLIASAFRSVRARVWIWVSEIVILPCIVWGTGIDPPFGGFNRWLLGYLPFGREFMPPFFPVQLVMVKLYTVLAAFSVGLIFVHLARRRAGRQATPDPTPGTASAASARGSRRRKWRQRWDGPTLVGGVVAVALVGLMMAAGAPILNGGVLDLLNGGRGGFQVPPAYFETRAVLSSHHANALVLPSLGLYMSTKWGFTGVTGFYSEFYYPSKILVPAYYGPYEFLLNSTRDSYATATQAIVPGGNFTALPPSSATHWVQYNSTRPYYGYNLRPVANLTPFQWVEIAIPTTNPGLLVELIDSQQVRLGLRTNSLNIGWYVLSRGGESLIAASSPTSVTVGLLVGGPTGGRFDPSSVNGVALRLPSTAYFPLLGLGPLTLVGASASQLASGWWTLITGTYHLSYLIVDLTILHGKTEPLAYAQIVAETLVSEGRAIPVSNTPSLLLFELT